MLKRKQSDAKDIIHSEIIEKDALIQREEIIAKKKEKKFVKNIKANARNQVFNIVEQSFFKSSDKFEITFFR